MSAARRPGPAPRTPYQAVLAAAGDLPGSPTALDAELLGSALLGSVYAVSAPDRAAAVTRFVDDFAAATAPDPTARLPHAVFAALTGAPAARRRDLPPPAGRHDDRPAGDGPRDDSPRTDGPDGDVGGGGAPWVGQLGRVRLTGTLGYGDIHGDVSGFAATFAYDEPAGGPEHTVAVLVDHQLGRVREAFVIRSAEAFRAGVAPLAEDALSWYAEPAPAGLAALVRRAFAAADTAPERPDDEAAGADRLLIAARLAAIPLTPPPTPAPGTAAGGAPEDGAAGEGPPEGGGVPPWAFPPPADAPAEQAAFLRSPEAAAAGLRDLDPADAAARDYCLGLLWRYQEAVPDDVRRWSPTKVRRFLTTWIPQAAVLDAVDAAMLPRVLTTWATYCARLRSLPAAALYATLTAVDAQPPVSPL
ncbi:hypothetical protein GCM10010124_29970 [Pilimelia terevasa]|uniref:Uncharacterized protein n=1 Tax=Pilimelia terevasa TaxID=53372 RepID=A0A8J3BP24_9ACTN|nr:hypothetical protein [Pilimelia terevasa]GGK35288.1 hypothetical protein GCM10010124_29970 [Pilimelia terevasa]